MKRKWAWLTRFTAEPDLLLVTRDVEIGRRKLTVVFTHDYVPIHVIGHYALWDRELWGGRGQPGKLAMAAITAARSATPAAG